MSEPAVRIPSHETMKGKGRTQRKGFGYVMAAPMAVLLIVAAMTVYDYGNALFKSAQANARAETYFAEQSGPFCLMEGVGIIGRMTKRLRLAVLR